MALHVLAILPAAPSEALLFGEAVIRAAREYVTEREAAVTISWVNPQPERRVNALHWMEYLRRISPGDNRIVVEEMSRAPAPHADLFACLFAYNRTGDSDVILMDGTIIPERGLFFALTGSYPVMGDDRGSPSVPISPSGIGLIVPRLLPAGVTGRRVTAQELPLPLPWPQTPAGLRLAAREAQGDERSNQRNQPCTDLDTPSGGVVFLSSRAISAMKAMSGTPQNRPDEAAEADDAAPAWARWALGSGSRWPEHLAARVRWLGFGAVIAETFGGVPTLSCAQPSVEQGPPPLMPPVAPFARPHPDDLAERLAIYDLPKRGTIAVCMSIRVLTGFDLRVVEQVIRTLAGSGVDALIVSLGNNPADVLKAPDAGTLTATLRASLASSLAEMARVDDPGILAALFAKWLRTCLGDAVRTHVFASEVQDAAAERAALHKMAHTLGYGWALDLNYDEVLACPPGTLHRLTAHPSPTVRAYDFSILTLWTSEYYRDDPPYGGGADDRLGRHEVRLWRLPGAGQDPFLPGSANLGGVAFSPPVSSGAVRVANVNLLRLSLSDPAQRVRAGISEPEIGARLSRPVQGRLGLTMLTHIGESPEDIARHLDDLHGLADVVVISPTDGGTPALSPEYVPLVALANRFQAKILPAPLADDIAGARNIGLDALRAYRVLPPGPGSTTSAAAKPLPLRWGLFLDPDEYLLDPLADGAALRRALQSERMGWLARFRNLLPGGAVSVSDSVRLVRLDVENWRMNGRVHESFEDAIAHHTRTKGHPRLAFLAFTFGHRGMSNAAINEEKLARYDRLLRLEIADRPDRSGPWVSLAANYLQAGDYDAALTCYRHAVSLGGTSYLPWKELGLRFLADAVWCLQEADARTSEAHPWSAKGRAVLASLERLGLGLEHGGGGHHTALCYGSPPPGSPALPPRGRSDAPLGRLNLDLLRFEGGPSAPADAPPPGGTPPEG